LSLFHSSFSLNLKQYRPNTPLREKNNKHFHRGMCYVTLVSSQKSILSVSAEKQILQGYIH
jgi:hypothetical protein